LLGLATRGTLLQAGIIAPNWGAIVLFLRHG
jgi:hypothetical protein